MKTIIFDNGANEFYTVVFYSQIQGTKHVSGKNVSSLKEPMRLYLDQPSAHMEENNYCNLNYKKLLIFPETNSSPLKIGGWETTFLLGGHMKSRANC